MPRLHEPAVQSPLSRRRLAITLASIACAALVAGVLAFDRLPSVIGDNAEFAILGKAIADGKGMRYLNHPDGRASTKYPPGFPLMLAGWIRVFGQSIYVMKAQVLTLFVLMVALTYLLARTVVGESLGVLSALLVATSATVLQYSHDVLSDVPYGAVSLLALVIIGGAPRGRWLLLAGIVACLWAYAVRTAGVSLVAACAIFFALRGRKREAVILVGGAAAFSVAWLLRNRFVAGEGSRYLGVLLAANPYDPDLGLITAGGVLVRIWKNLAAYAAAFLPGCIVPTLVIQSAGVAGTGALGAVVSLSVLAVAVVGGVALHKRVLLLNMYVLLYMVMCLLWPETWRSDRFMVPIAPVVGAYFLFGAWTALRYFRAKRIAALIVCCALVATNVVSLYRYAARERGYTPGWYNFLTTAEWVRENTPEDSIVLSRSPFLYYLISQRQSISYPFTRDLDAFRRYLAEWRPDYVVVDNGIGFTSTEKYLLPALRNMKDDFAVVYSTEEPVNFVLKYSGGGAGE